MGPLEDFRHGVVVLFGGGSDRALLEDLEHAFADYEARCFRNPHVTYRQCCDLRHEFGPQAEVEFPEDCLPLRRAPWVALLERLEREISGLPGPLEACFRLGFCLEALERQAGDRSSPFERWRHWPDPDHAPYPLHDFRAQCRRLRSWSPGFPGADAPLAADLTEASFRRRRRQGGPAEYGQWVLATCREVVDRAINDPGLARAVAEAIEARPAPEAQAAGETDTVIVTGHGDRSGEGCIRLTTTGPPREFIARGRSRRLILEVLLDAHRSTPDTGGSLVAHRTLNELFAKDARKTPGCPPAQVSSVVMSDAARAALGRLRKALTESLGPPRGGEYIESLSGEGIRLSRQIRWLGGDANPREITRDPSRLDARLDHPPRTAGGGRRRPRPPSSGRDD
jgi:hypothetical protein